MGKKIYSERAKYRLRIAAGFLRSQGRGLNFSRAEFYECIQQLLANLPETQRQQLKSLTDWVEAYDGRPVCVTDIKYLKK